MMKPYTTTTKDTCWKDSLACLLEIEPKRVPDFVKLYGNEYMNKSREWLKEKWGKGLVYIPASAFMETGKLRQNGPIGPEGYSIAYMSMVAKDAAHALVCFNGGVFWDNGDDRSKEYDHIDGYYVIYDLQGAKVTPKKRHKRRKKKRGTSKKPIITKKAKVSNRRGG